MTQDDVERIVAGLGEGERKALLAAAECKGGKWWTPYAKDLRRAGLQRDGVLNELGLAVRARLERTDHA